MNCNDEYQDKKQWETINRDIGRIKIDGGYLYVVATGAALGMSFVPDSKESLNIEQRFEMLEENINSLNDRITEIDKNIDNALAEQGQEYKELLNKGAELSMKLSMMQSSLREFEKQKFDPLQKEHYILRELIDNTWCKTFERIENLESHINEISNYECHNRALIDGLQERIEKLEKHKNYQIDENRKISKRVDELENGINGIKELWLNVNKLRSQKEECQHEYGSRMLLSNPSKMQCTKCGFILCLPNAIHMNIDDAKFEKDEPKC